jgi:pyruvate/2-oxoglutarate/acetoin dehydrogenase E1 component
VNEFELSYSEARIRALCRELDANPDLVVFGGYFAHPFMTEPTVLERYPDRILWPPISEFAMAGLAVGAAMEGMRPLVAIGTSSFMFYGWAPITNEAPVVRYVSGGRVVAPAVYHIFAGARRYGGIQHEHTPQAMLQNVPGLRLYAPGTPADVDGAFHSALTGSDPVVIVDHPLLAEARGMVPADPPSMGGPQLLREGEDVLLIAYSLMAQRALMAAEALEREGVSAAVLNLRTLSPAPTQGVLETAREHRALVFIDESRAAGSPASLLMAQVFEVFPGHRARLICSADAPSPFSAELLDHVVPTVERIAGETLELVRGRTK